MDALLHVPINPTRRIGPSWESLIELGITHLAPGMGVLHHL